MPDTFNSFGVPTDLANCPFEASPWAQIDLVRAEAIVNITYKCGTFKTVDQTGGGSTVQSGACVRKQLHDLLNITDPALRLELDKALADLAAAQETEAAQAIQINDLQLKIAELEGRLTKAVGFEVKLGKPKAKG